MNATKSVYWLLSFLLGFFLLCTIQDDNGNPVNPQQPEKPVVIDPDAVPLLFASADSTYIKQRDTLAIIARVFADTSGGDSLRPLAGARVTATASSGRILDDTITTDNNGRARFLFTDTVNGRVEITLKVSTAVQTFRFEITDTPDRVQKRIEVLPGRAVIKADNMDTTTISVSIINELHNPVSGEQVQFITTSGVIIGDGSSTKSSGQSTTDINGIASATLRSANINDTAFVTAYLVSDQSLSDETDVVFRGMTISVQSTRANMVIGDTTLITARLLNASGAPVIKVPVFSSFSKGTSSNLRFLTRDTITNYDGYALFKVRATANGMDNIIFSAAGTDASLQVNVSSLKLTLSVDKTILQTRETDSSVITATFTNNTGTPLNGRLIKLTRNYKTVTGSDTTDFLSSTTNQLGKSYFTIKALSYEGSMRTEAVGFDQSEGYASADAVIQFMTTRVMTIRGPAAIPADGESLKPITVVVKNKSGNPIIGDEVTFTTTAGVIPTNATTDKEGRAIVNLTSDRRNIAAVITATLSSDPTKTQSITVDFTGVNIEVSTNPPSISSDGHDTSHILITLVDAAQKPISGEPINFYKQQLGTTIRQIDTLTDNSGEARCVVYGTGSGRDTIRISAAGATGSTVINYSSNRIIVDTAAGQSCIADSSDSTLFNVTYLMGDNVTRIPGALLEISATVGEFDTIFARSFTTDPNGLVAFYLHNPHFATTATISVLAYTATEITSQMYQLYFRANNVYKIDLSGTPEVIGVETGKAKITAIAYDKNQNRVKNARITFNLVNGPSGGEHLSPPTALTGDDGVAQTYLVAGKTPSTFRQIWITAGSFSSIKSDTIKFTIAGPPANITIRANVLKGENPNDGTFALPCAAIVTDINGNPVVDGTDVTFSLKISSYVMPKLTAHWWNDIADGVYSCYYSVDTVFKKFEFEDFNDNYTLDPGEDRNNDGFANRGEDINGDGKYIRGPDFEDINNDGVRQYNPLLPVEEMHSCFGNSKNFADLNNNASWDPIEPLTNSVYRTTYEFLKGDSAFYYYPVIRNSQDSIAFATLAYYDSLYEHGAGYHKELGSYDIDVARNGVPDPNTAVAITRTVETLSGKSLNKIIYGQSDATHIEVMIWAESQGVSTLTPERIILPIVKDEK
ncbi:MAG TPA: Ig-like domain-containing protein [Chitinispirillaceae bacterium]|nr:Ig-like domain-containing protein [Chitinispirillaceae bacterium]